MKHGRRWFVLGALLLAGGAGWVGWLEVRSADRWEQLSASRRPAASPYAVWPLAASPVAGASSAPSMVASMPTDGVAGIEAEKESVELCGFGRVTREQVESWSPVEQAKLMAYKHALEQRGDTAVSRLSARLATGSDRERVASRLLMDDREGAALVAAATKDAEAYRLALLACGVNTASAPTCKALSTQGWARLDPDNAGPWLRLLGDAVSKRDDVAATEAVEQVLKRHNRNPSRPLLQMAHGASEVVDDKVALGLAVVDIVGRDAALPDAGPFALLRFCRKESVIDGARKGYCERLARWQFAQADSVMDGGVALALADRVGLPTEERPFTKEQLDRGHSALIDQSMQFSGYDCASLTGAAAWPALFSQKSELQMAFEAADQRNRKQ